MLRPETVGSALDIRTAVGWPDSAERRIGLPPDEAMQDFVQRYLGPPACGRRGDEPVVIYDQHRGPALVIGAYGSETRVRAWLPGLPGRICPAAVSMLTPIRPERITRTTHDASSEADLTKLPIPLLTERDAGRYLTMGFVMAGDQDVLALSAHRMLVLSPTRLGLWMLRDRRLRLLADAAHSRGEVLPVSINIGVAPAVAIASATSTAVLPDGLDKLSLAGALAGAPIQTSDGESNGCRFLSSAEIVLEGHIVPETVPEAPAGAALAGSMPEFLGYDGSGQSALQVVELRRMRMRPNALFQAVAGPGREQSVILGLGGALSLALALSRDDTSIHDLRFSHAGGGMLLLFVALDRGRRGDLGELARQLVGICPFTKVVIFVDRDVDLSSEEDVLWAMTTRANLAQDCYPLPGYPALAMDPSQSPAWRQAKGPVHAFKSFIDATVPGELGGLTHRSYDGYAAVTDGMVTDLSTRSLTGRYPTPSSEDGRPLR